MEKATSKIKSEDLLQAEESKNVTSYSALTWALPWTKLGFKGELLVYVGDLDQNFLSYSDKINTKKQYQEIFKQNYILISTSKLPSKTKEFRHPEHIHTAVAKVVEE